MEGKNVSIVERDPVLRDPGSDDDGPLVFHHYRSYPVPICAVAWCGHVHKENRRAYERGRDLLCVVCCDLHPSWAARWS